MKKKIIEESLDEKLWFCLSKGKQEGVGLGQKFILEEDAKEKIQKVQKRLKELAEDMNCYGHDVEAVDIERVDEVFKEEFGEKLII